LRWISSEIETMTNEKDQRHGAATSVAKSKAEPHSGQRGQHQGKRGAADDRSARPGKTKTRVDDSGGSRTGSPDNDDDREPGDRGREGEGEPPLRSR
jgi:hypothetical protein